MRTFYRLLCLACNNIQSRKSDAETCTNLEKRCCGNGTKCQSVIKEQNFPLQNQLKKSIEVDRRLRLLLRDNKKSRNRAGIYHSDSFSFSVFLCFSHSANPRQHTVKSTDWSALEARRVRSPRPKSPFQPSAARII